jgi:HPt (histidine-containing phosphotransfer) domain-containing protein
MPTDADQLPKAIAALWVQARPRYLERLATVDEGLRALAAGRLDDDLRTRARDEAHRLAGALGTFGMPAGSRHARALEERLTHGRDPADAAGTGSQAAAVRRAIEAGPSQGG